MDEQKLNAAKAALDYVEDGMKLGLGTGSTAAKFVDLLGEKVKDGLKVTCVPTSEETRQQAEKLGIPLTTLDETPDLDLTVDGADEISEDLCLIKGGGGALLREKIVASASNQVIIIADQSKLVDNLGKFPLPIEVVQFGLGSTKSIIEQLNEEFGSSAEVTLRQGADGKPFVTDNGNYILDCHYGQIPDPLFLEEALKVIPGVVTTGLFIGIADFAILGTPEGVETVEWSYDHLEENFIDG